MFTAQDVKKLRDQTGAGMMDCKKALQASEGDMEEAITWLREKGIAKAAKKESRIAAEGLSHIEIEGNNAVILEINSETDFVASNDEFKELVNTIAKALVKSNATTLEEALEVKIENITIKDYIIAKVAKIGEKISLRRFEKVTKEDNQSFGAYKHMGGKMSVLTLVNNVTEEIAKDVAMHACAMRPQYIKEEDVPEEVIEKEKTILTEQAVNEGKPKEIAEKMVAGRIKKYFKEICLLDQPFIKDSDITVGQYVNNNNGEVVKMIRYEVGEGIEKKCDNFAEEVQSQMNN